MKTLLVSGNPGGARILASWAARQLEKHFEFFLSSAAEDVFARYFSNVVNKRGLVPLDKLLSGCDELICSTSVTGEPLEKDAIALAKMMGVPSAAYLDHWVSYRQRFVSEGAPVLPDEIWVGDVYGLEIARSEFPAKDIKLVPNNIFSSIKSSCFSVPKLSQRPKDIKVLYLTEYNDLKRASGNSLTANSRWDEKETVNFFLSNVIKILPESRIEKIVFRVHPLEIQSDYEWILKSYPTLPLEFSEERDLERDCRLADLIVGRETMAMVEALYMGKTVISCVPPNSVPGCLPFKSILDFASLLSGRQELPQHF